jgi:hypothetical protein
MNVALSSISALAYSTSTSYSSVNSTSVGDVTPSSSTSM